MNPTAPLLAGEQEALDATAQWYLERIYSDINSIWKHKCEFPGTFFLPSSFNDTELFVEDARRRCTEAESMLGIALLHILLYSQTFSEVVASEQPYSEHLWVQILRRVKENELSLGHFAVTRSSTWFDNYPMDKDPPQIPENCTCPPINHPHEVYRAEDGTIKRSIFQSDFNSYHPMNNITENTYTSEHWSRHVEKPKTWPRWQPFPGDPSICPPDGYGPYARCHGGCKQRTGTRNSRCACIADKTYKHALVEVIQMVSWRPGELNRGVRALARINKDDYIGEYCGEYIPYDHNDLPRFGDSTYAFEWEPTPKFDRRTGLEVEKENETEDDEPTATLIGGRNGNWAKFINHTEEGRHNVEFRSLAIGGKMRLVVQAIRDIAAGEELKSTYGDLHFTRRSSRIQKLKRQTRTVYSRKPKCRRTRY